MYVQNTDFLARAQAVYPGACALEVDSRGVLVHCDPCQGNRRDIPGGTVRLGTSPATAALAREILAATAPDEDEGPEPPYAGYESEAELRRMAEVRALRAKGQG